MIRDLVEYFAKIALHILHNHEKMGKLERRRLGEVLILADDDVVELCRESVTFHLREVPQYLYFSNYLPNLVWSRKYILDQFNGYNGVGGFLTGLDDLPEASNHYKLENLIIFLDIFPEAT